MKDEELIENVKKAINPKFQDWVLFQNGTYIIIENAEKSDSIEEKAIQVMKEYGPVFIGSPAGDFSVITLNKTKGWVVSGHGYGMYTYVHPSELESENPQDAEIGIYGRNKRDIDGKSPILVYINRSK